jgi:hypothetical protein
MIRSHLFVTMFRQSYDDSGIRILLRFDQLHQTLEHRYLMFHETLFDKPLLFLRFLRPRNKADVKTVRFTVKYLHRASVLAFLLESYKTRNIDLLDHTYWLRKEKGLL